MFSPPSQSNIASQAMPTAPAPPPNPPQFGANQAGTNQLRRQTASNSGFAGTIIGGSTGAASTSNKTLLGA